MKKCIIVVLFLLAMLFAGRYYVYNYIECRAQVDCIGFVENMEIDDKTTFSCWKTSPERAKEYLKYLSNIETIELEEIKKIEEVIEQLDDESRVLIAVAGEISYIAVNDNFGIVMPRKGTIGTKKVYFYTTEYDGSILPE